MAATKRNAMTRVEACARIKTLQIIDRLQNHIVAQANSKKLMSPEQVRAALGLLKKTVPDLSAVTIEGQPDGQPVQFIMVGRLPQEK